MRWNDRVYGDVAIDDPLLISLIQGPTFQRLRGIRQAGDRTVDIGEAALAKLAGQKKRMRMRNGGAFDREATGLHRRGSAILGEPHGARCLIVGDHRHDRIGIDGGIPW